MRRGMKLGRRRGTSDRRYRQAPLPRPEPIDAARETLVLRVPPPAQLAENMTKTRQPRQFILVPGREGVEIEDVISRTDRYEIVRKHGEAGAIAEQIANP